MQISESFIIFVITKGKNIMTTLITQELQDKISAALKAKTNPQIYWDYRDELSEEQIQKIVAGDINDVENEIWENVQDSGNTYDIEQEHLKDVLEDFDAELRTELGIEDDDDIDFEDLATDLRDLFIDEISIDLDFKTLIKRASANVRIEMTSNYDCINSHWFETSGGGGYEYRESYFGAMVDALKLNPAKVKQVLKKHGVNTFGAFPNKKYRDGKELISYEDFFTELENSCCGGNLLTFVGTIDLEEFLNLEDGKITKIIIPKGNCVGLFSSFQGGGSTIEAELLHDFTVDLTKIFKTSYDGFRLVTDHKEHGYTIQESHGVTQSFWGSNITLL